MYMFYIFLWLGIDWNFKKMLLRFLWYLLGLVIWIKRAPVLHSTSIFVLLHALDGWQWGLESLFKKTCPRPFDRFYGSYTLSYLERFVLYCLIQIFVLVIELAFWTTCSPQILSFFFSIFSLELIQCCLQSFVRAYVQAIEKILRECLQTVSALLFNRLFLLLCRLSLHVTPPHGFYGYLRYQQDIRWMWRFLENIAKAVLFFYLESSVTVNDSYCLSIIRYLVLKWYRKPMALPPLGYSYSSVDQDKELLQKIVLAEDWEKFSKFENVERFLHLLTHSKKVQSNLLPKIVHFFAQIEQIVCRCLALHTLVQFLPMKEKFIIGCLFFLLRKKMFPFSSPYLWPCFLVPCLLIQHFFFAGTCIFWMFFLHLYVLCKLCFTSAQRKSLANLFYSYGKKWIHQHESFLVLWLGTTCSIWISQGHILHVTFCFFLCFLWVNRKTYIHSPLHLTNETKDEMMKILFLPEEKEIAWDETFKQEEDEDLVLLSSRTIPPIQAIFETNPIDRMIPNYY